MADKQKMTEVPLEYQDSTHIRRRDVQARAAAAVVAIGLGLLLMAFAIDMISKIRSNAGSELKIALGQLSNQSGADKASMESFAQAIRKLEFRTEAITQPKPESAIGIELADLKAKVAELQQSLNRLEKAVGADPARAVELPLIRRDLEHQKESQISALAAFKESVDRSITMIMWALGLFGAVITAAAGALIVPMFRKPSSAA